MVHGSPTPSHALITTPYDKMSRALRYYYKKHKGIVEKATVQYGFNFLLDLEKLFGYSPEEMLQIIRMQEGIPPKS